MDIPETGVQIRTPSTANLMIDSVDRQNYQAGVALPPFANSFLINKTNSILNGFFNRIATAEVVLEWFVPNFAASANNLGFDVDISGAGASTGTGAFAYTINPGYYNQAQLLRALLPKLTSAGGAITPAITWTIAPLANQAGCVITPSSDVWIALSGPVATLLGFNLGPAPGGYFLATAANGIVVNIVADLRRIRYLDFVSAQLTYNQELKDSATNVVSRDVLCRWYMAYDNPPQLDEFGFPILMGYTGFVLRRLFSPPKNIKWDPRQPVGQLSFEVYADNNQLAPFNFNSNWLMTLQVSEN